MAKIYKFASFYLVLMSIGFACQTVSQEEVLAESKKDTPARTSTVYIPTVMMPDNTYYIAINGDDQFDGLSEDSAFRTIEHALEIVQPGDTILVFPGTYNENLTVENVGGLEAPITIRGSGSPPILDGQNTMTYGLWFENCVNIVIDNIEIRNFTDIGIGVYLSDQIILRNLIVHHNGFAVQLADWELEGYGVLIDESQHITLDSNDVFQNGPQPRPFGVLGTGIDVYECTDCLIRDNLSHENIGGGILVEDSINVLVERNTITENYLDATEDEWWDGGIWIDGGHDIVLKNNIFKDNVGPGIQISNEEHQNPYGYVLEGNISSNNYYGIYIWNFGTSSLPPDEILHLENNQIISNTVQDIWVVPWECPPPDPCDE